MLIAAITSCTNTSNPSVMLGAGLVARNARRAGLTSKPWVKTSLSPGSKVVTDYFTKAGLLDDLAAIGFDVTGYGCMTCIGNSGPLRAEISAGVKAGEVIGTSVLSGNRNFEGRVHPEVKMNFLASPPLVVAYALAGTTDIDLNTEPLGTGSNGQPVYLKDIWPSPAEVAETVRTSITSKMFKASYDSVFEGDANWRSIKVPLGKLYQWDDASTYVRNPPYFEGMTMTPRGVSGIRGARALALLGDSVTTDHISPAGDIARGSPAARYLESKGVQKVDFNSYGARRGNHEVMMRGTFANIRLRNLLAPGTEGGVTVHIPSGETMSIYDASMKYQAAGTPLVVLAGKEYGTGSSRDWAAKGTMLLGVKAVVSESFERIHRSNLIGMGVLPCQFVDGQNAQSLGLTGREVFDFGDLKNGEARTVAVTATPESGLPIRFEVRVRIDTPKERDYFRHGGILHYVLRQLAASGQSSAPVASAGDGRIRGASRIQDTGRIQGAGREGACRQGDGRAEDARAEEARAEVGLENAGKARTRQGQAEAGHRAADDPGPQVGREEKRPARRSQCRRRSCRGPPARFAQDRVEDRLRRANLRRASRWRASPWRAPRRHAASAEAGPRPPRARLPPRAPTRRRGWCSSISTARSPAAIRCCRMSLGSCCPGRGAGGDWPACCRPVLRFTLGRLDRGALKGALIRAGLGGAQARDIDDWNSRFLPRLLAQGLFPGAIAAIELHRRRGDHLVLMSASVDLYVPEIARRLGFDAAICSGVAWTGGRLDGRLSTANRRDEEKARCFRATAGEHPGKATVAYGNTASDLPHMVLANRAVMVNPSKTLRRLAEAHGIECVRW